MNQRRHNRFVVALLLLAALGSYANVPRISAQTRMGDTLNAARVLDVTSHIRLAALAAAPDSSQLQEDLEDGRRSLELIADTPLLISAVPPLLRYTPPRLAPDEHDPQDFEPAPHSALPGALLTLDLPPPGGGLQQPCLLRALPATLAFVAARPPPVL